MPILRMAASRAARLSASSSPSMVTAARIGAQQAEEALEHDRLADARAADHHHRLPGADVEIEAVEHDLACERLAQPAQGDLGLVRAPTGAVARGRVHWAKNASVMT